MTNDNTTNTTAWGNPDAAETVLPKGKPTVSDEKIRSLQADLDKEIRRTKLRRDERDALQKKVDELQGQLDTAIADSGKVAKEFEDYKAKFNEDAIAKENVSLKRGILSRDLFDKIKSTEGVKLQEKVQFEDLLRAAGKYDEFEKLQGDKIPEDFTTKVLEAAKAERPFLFASPDAAVQPGESESAVRKEAAQQQSALRAFGAQAAGGGSAPTGSRLDPAQQVDWRDPAAINRFISSTE